MSSSKVKLIPWDPDSPSHIDRMTAQRIACGWKSDKVEEWRESQRQGSMNLQWIVATDPEISIPDSPLEDSATTFGGDPRTGSKEQFVPAGHISLNTEYETPESVEMIEGQYFISNFFILKTIQGAGLGRAAMDVIEARAIAEPLNAKTLALSTVDDEALGEGVIEALGMGRGISNMKWYGRRGYEAFKRVEGNWSDVDKNGKRWGIPAVFMRKDIK